MQNIPRRWFFAELEGFEAKVFAKKEVNLRLLTSSKSDWTSIFKGFLRLLQYFHFYVSYVPDILLTDSSEFRQCLKDVKHTSTIIFRWAGRLWSESFAEKKSEGQNFRHPRNPIEPLFFVETCHFKAFQLNEKLS